MGKKKINIEQAEKQYNNLKIIYTNYLKEKIEAYGVSYLSKKISIDRGQFYVAIKRESFESIKRLSHLIKEMEKNTKSHKKGVDK